MDVLEDIDFADLHLTRRHTDDKLFFDWEVVMRACTEWQVDFMRLRESESAIRKFLLTWYKAHRDFGGAADAVAEELVAEASLVETRGGGFFYPPGRA
jgi:hypothetical protein